MVLSEEQKKINRRELMKKYNEKNKDKLKMNRELKKEEKKEYDKIYRQENKHKLNQQRKEYMKTENGLKLGRIKNWKRLGIISNDWNDTYDKFINCNNCESCNCDLVYGNSKYGKTLDHDHITGEIRNILCRCCNAKLPRQ